VRAGFCSAVSVVAGFHPFPPVFSGHHGNGLLKVRPLEQGRQKLYVLRRRVSESVPYPPALPSDRGSIPRAGTATAMGGWRSSPLRSPSLMRVIIREYTRSRQGLRTRTKPIIFGIAGLTPLRLRCPGTSVVLLFLSKLLSAHPKQTASEGSETLHCYRPVRWFSGVFRGLVAGFSEASTLAHSRSVRCTSAAFRQRMIPPSGTYRRHCRRAR
jgi:hypothetical protein